MKNFYFYLLGFLILFLTFCKTSQAQDSLWLRTYGWGPESQAVSMCKSYDGGYILIGYYITVWPNEYALRILRVNEIGDSVWSSIIQRDGKCFRGESIVRDETGSYLVNGISYIHNIQNSDTMFYAKYNDFGDTVWTKRYGFARWAIRSIRTLDSGFATIGMTRDGRQYLLRVSPNADSQWVKLFNPPYSTTISLYDIMQLPNGNFILAGGINPENEAEDCYIYEVNSLGDSVWSRQFGGNGQNGESLYDLLVADDGFYAGGTIAPYLTPGDGFLVKMNFYGEIEWTREYGGFGSDRIYDMVRCNDGNIILLLQSESTGPPGFNVRLIKIEPDGDVIWDSAFGGENEDSGFSMELADDGGIVIGGRSNSFGNGNYRFMVLKVSDIQSGIAINYSDVDYSLPINAYPNPFNTSTILQYSIESNSPIYISIYNLVGQQIKVLSANIQEAGQHSIILDGGTLSSGIYLIKVNAGNFEGNTKVTYLK